MVLQLQATTDAEFVLSIAALCFKHNIPEVNMPRSARAQRKRGGRRYRFDASAAAAAQPAARTALLLHVRLICACAFTDRLPPLAMRRSVHALCC